MIVLAAAAGVYLAVKPTRRTAVTKLAGPSFTPYVDVTLTPASAFQNSSTDPARNVTLGFIVASPTAPCTPTWGTHDTLSQAETTLGLDRRIRQLINEGGVPTASFGGADNTELAIRCTSTVALASAYESVLSRYRLSSADFDIEGAALANTAANTRRAAAIAGLQGQARRAGKPLQVWLTLPVEPNGFDAEALNAIHATLAGGVALTGVNLLAMDFAPGLVPGDHMLAAVESALRAAHGQLEGVDAEAGIGSTAASVWNHLGVTVMIGQNDVAGEQFTLPDAHELLAFVSAEKLSRLSIWSLNRDTQCGSAFAEVGVHSDTCSGVAETPGEFTRLFSQLSTAASP